MRKYALIAVEGNHDQALIEKVLRKIMGFKRFSGNAKDLDQFWKKFVPKYPPKKGTKEGKLYVRLDMPSILLKENLSVGIYAGEGSNVLSNLEDQLSDMDCNEFFSFGIIADSDKNPPETVAKNYCSYLQKLFPKFPDTPGEVKQIGTRTGIFVVPNNEEQGVLETVLLKCGKVAYREYLQRANDYIDRFSEEEQKKLDWSRFDKEKAIIATVVSVLKPSKTNQTSISDNQWISSETAESVEDLQKLVSFLEDLLGLKNDDASS